MTRHPVIPLHVDAGREEGDAAGDGDVATPSRRAVVKWLAASAALAASGCSRPPDGLIYTYARLPEIMANGEPRYYASASLLGGFARGVLVGTQQGRPVKVEGNPGHPASLGGTDVFAQAEILQLWDPDRAKLVQRSVGQGRTASATWPAFAAAWRERMAAGSGALHVLAPRSTSPAEMAQLAALLARHPGARWYRDDAGLGDSAGQGALMAFGRAVRTVRHFDRARLIVAFGGDPFSQAADGVRQSADWSRVRGAALAAGRAPPRLVALETSPGLFGARADERWALSPPAIEAVLWRSASRFVADLPPRPAADDPALAPVADRLVALLAQYRGDALLCAGDGLSAASHALLHALHQRLGAWGRTLDAIAAPDHSDALPPPGTLADLVGAMRGRSVDALVVLGGNPVYTAPARLDFAGALAQVPFSAHLSGWRDETAERCTWQLPCGHAFEQWGDARAFDGTATLLQPAIAPLYDTRSPLELLALLAGDRSGDAPDGQALVRAQWRRHAGAGDFEVFWRDSLRQGMVPDSAAPALDLPEARLPTAAPPMDTAPGPLWGVFPPDASVGDGSHANNGWLQELPRPFTSITWGNALHLGPRTAQALGLRSGDVVRVEAGDVLGTAAVEAPVWVQPGHAEHAATLPLGYGRRAAGSVGNGVGFDTAPLRTATSGAVALRLAPTGRRHDFALTQLQDTQHGRDLARTVSLAASQAPPPPPAPQPTLYPPAAQEGPAWGMAIDLDACIACNACTVACQAENNIPVVGPDEVRRGRVMHWIRIDSYRDEAERVVSQPVPCMHCGNAPCELVCPVGATVHDSEGLNVQVYNRCIGTRFCSNNCPYKVRRFNFRQYSDVTTETLKLMHNPDVSVRSRGVMEKCSYCVQRLSRARREVQKTGQPLPRDAVETACQSACPTRAIHFGDLSDAQSDVARAKASPRHYAMLEELNTHPRTTFLARVNASDGEPT